MKTFSLEVIPKRKTYSHTKGCPKISGKFGGNSGKNLSHSLKFACAYTYVRGPLKAAYFHITLATLAILGTL